MFKFAFLGTLYWLSRARAAVEDSPRVVIIGSGASGIAAASRLLQNGFQNVTILEAENRIGGRIHTAKFGDYWVDVGGQWVHGEIDNVVYELAWRLGVLEHWQYGMKPAVFSSKGSKLSESVSTDLLKFFMNVTASGAPSEFRNRSMGEYLAPLFQERMDDHPELTVDLKKSLLKMLDLFLMTWDSGNSWNEVSAHREDLICVGDQDINWKDKGFSMILDILMKKYPDPSKELPVMKKTILNSEVSKIDYNVPHGVVKVSTKNGFEYRAEHVIVTTSVGVLKSDYEKLFDPPLPEAKINAIKGIQLGNVGKIFLLYPEPWWENDSLAFFNIFWTEEDTKKYENDPEKSWLLSLVTVSAVEHKPKLLSFWLTGPHAREMESMPEERVFGQLKEIIRSFFGQTYTLTEPSNMLRSKWFTNKHFRGTWSYRNLETERLGVKAVDLQAPLKHDGIPIVLFAGEATSTKHSATVNGAIGSGWREANRLIKLYGRQKSSQERDVDPEFSDIAKIIVP